MMELQAFTSLVDSAFLGAILYALWKLDRRIVSLEMILKERNHT